MNIFEKFFHIDDVLRSKNHFCENGNYRTIVQEVDFLLLHFSFSFLKFLEFLLIDNILLIDMFTANTKSLSNSNSIKSYRGLKKHCQLI